MNAPKAPHWKWTRICAPPQVAPCLDEAALNEIALAINLKFLDGTDLRKLGLELGRCAIYLRILTQFRKRAQKRTEDAKIARRSLRGVIALPDSLVGPETKQNLVEVLKSLEVKMAAEKSRASEDKRKRQEKPEASVTVSDKEWLVGKYLAEIFNRAFGKQPTFAYNGTTQTPDSRFVSFVEKVLEANGIKGYASSSFKTALDRVKKAEERKNRRGQIPNPQFDHVMT